MRRRGLERGRLAVERWSHVSPEGGRFGNGRSESELRWNRVTVEEKRMGKMDGFKLEWWPHWGQQETWNGEKEKHEMKNEWRACRKWQFVQSPQSFYKLRTNQFGHRWKKNDNNNGSVNTFGGNQMTLALIWTHISVHPLNPSPISYHNIYITLLLAVFLTSINSWGKKMIHFVHQLDLTSPIKMGPEKSSAVNRS